MIYLCWLSYFNRYSSLDKCRKRIDIYFEICRYSFYTKFSPENIQDFIEVLKQRMRTHIKTKTMERSFNKGREDVFFNLFILLTSLDS